MSECKHSFNLNEGKFCKYCGINFDDLMRNIDVSNLEKERDELQVQVKEREREIEKIEAKCCQCHAGHVAQVAVLRGALEEVGKGHIESRFDHEDGRFVEVFVRDVHIVIDQALEQTPSEASERVNALVEALESIVKEDKNETTFEENFSNALAIAKQALAEWRNK